MFKLIKADLYKSFHRMYLYIFVAVMAGLAILYNVILGANGASREISFGSSLSLLLFPLYLVFSFADIVTAEENKEHTLKNTISYGISRSKLYIAKNISSILVSGFVALVTLAAFFGSGYMLLTPGAGFTTEFLSDYFIRISIAMLIYIAGINLGTMLAVLIKKNSLFSLCYIGLLMFPPLVFKLLSLINPIFEKGEFAMLSTQIQVIAIVPSSEMMTSVWIALAHIVVFNILGLIFFKRQEIN